MKIFIRVSLGAGSVAWRQMKPNGPAWSQHDSTREPTAAQMYPKPANMDAEAPKVRRKAINKTKQNETKNGGQKKVGGTSIPYFFPDRFFLG